MNDETRAALDAETPLNPYSVLAAVNSSSRSASRAWLAFLGLLAYLLLVLAGITHRDLLLNTDVVLPVLQVKVGLTRFFLWAPVVVMVLHAALLGQLALLARKVLEFEAALRLLESTERRTHPLRLELDGFFLAQVLAGPVRSRVVSAFLHSASWLTLMILPVLLLLYMQAAFLPFHDPEITLMHRLAVLADLMVLVLFGVFLLHQETSYFGAFVRAVAHNPGSMTFGATVLGAAAFFSLFIAGVPGARDERSVLFGADDGSLFGLLPRNIALGDAALLAGKELSADRPSISLRGRDLRNAKLDRADLRQADLTGADLDGASLAGADLRGAQIGCVDLGALTATQDRVGARCASARGANFRRARLAGARMAGMDLRGAQLDEALLEGADLSYGLMSGASFSRARLQRASLGGGAMLQGANFQRANLQGADLAGAKLQLADFSSASLQAANLSFAVLDGALLRSADLEGADLRQTRLYGTDFSEARLAGADLTRAKIWRTVPPSSTSVELADIAQIIIKAPSDDELGLLKAAVTSLDSVPLRDRLNVRIGPLADATSIGSWSAEPDALAWASLLGNSGGVTAAGYGAKLSEYLANLMCGARFQDGAVAAGVVRRAKGEGFKGDAARIHDRLKAADCAAAGTLPAGLLRDLAVAAEAARASAPQ